MPYKLHIYGIYDIGNKTQNDLSWLSHSCGKEQIKIRMKGLTIGVDT